MTDGQRPRYTKRDANQPDIVDDLRGLGFYVLDLADVGGDALDIFVCGHIGGGEWRWLAVEIKTPGGQLTPKQKRFFEMCRRARDRGAGDRGRDKVVCTRSI